MEKFVVIAAKKMNGSKVFSAAQSKEEANKSLKSIEAAPHLSQYGPFSIILAAEAERKKMYGD